MTDVVKNELSRYFKDMLYVCTRHESAWGYGTMSLDDFIPAWDDDEVLNSIMSITKPVIEELHDLFYLKDGSVLDDAEGRIWEIGSDEEVQWVTTLGLEDGFPLEDVALPATLLKGGFVEFS